MECQIYLLRRGRRPSYIHSKVTGDQMKMENGALGMVGLKSSQMVQWTESLLQTVALPECESLECNLDFN